MQQKARETFQESQLLFANRRYNGAANRAYYALYQALVVEFERLKKTPGDFNVVPNAKGQENGRIM